MALLFFLEQNASTLSARKFSFKRLIIKSRNYENVLPDRLNLLQARL